MVIDLDKEEVRFAVKKGAKFDAEELSKSFARNGFSRVEVKSRPKGG